MKKAWRVGNRTSIQTFVKCREIVSFLEPQNNLNMADQKESVRKEREHNCLKGGGASNFNGAKWRFYL